MKKTPLKLTIKVSAKKRAKYIDSLLKLDGIAHIKEDPKLAYCPISLTLVPDKIKPILKDRQTILKQILEKAGLKNYDPSSSPTSPDMSREADHTAIYLEDSQHIANARFFVGHCVLASTGWGVELKLASDYNRIAVVLLDQNIRVSRMLPPRVIYLQYKNFSAQASQFVEVFKFLQQFEPGIGLKNNKPILIGFNKLRQAVDLEEEVYTKFPDLKFTYNGQIPTLEMKALNSQILK